MEKIAFVMKDPDFLTYYDNDKLFLYSEHLKESLELNNEVLKTIKVEGFGFNHLGFGIINFNINDSKMPILVPDFIVPLFNNVINEIERFHAFFSHIVTNEINLRGKKIESLTFSNVNKQSFEYLYRNNPKYGVTLEFGVKYFEKINKLGLNSFSINYPEEVHSLKNEKGRIINKIQAFIFDLYKIDNNEYQKTINREDDTKDLTKEIKKPKKQTTRTVHQKNLDRIFDLVEIMWMKETNRTAERLEKIYKKAKGQFAKKEGKDRSQLNNELRSTGGFEEIKAKIIKVYRENL